MILINTIILNEIYRLQGCFEFSSKTSHMSNNLNIFLEIIVVGGQGDIWLKMQWKWSDYDEDSDHESTAEQTVSILCEK